MTKAIDAPTTGTQPMSSAERVIPPAIPSPRRRFLFAGAAAALVAGAIPSHAAQIASVGRLVRGAGPDAGLLASDAQCDLDLLHLGRALNAARAYEDAAWSLFSGKDNDENPSWVRAEKASDAASAIVGQIEGATATTLAGLLVKISALEWCRCGDSITIEDLDQTGD